MKTMKTMNKVVVPTSLFAAATLLAPSLALAASDAIITEYVEGSGNNKAVELYNPSEASIDLAGYVLEIYFNGSTTVGTSIALSGTIASHDTFVVADNDANAGILAVTDQSSTANFFNGDDANVLRHDGAVVDSLGQVGTDPGSQWGSGLLSTQDNTLVRDPALVADTDPTDAVTLDGWIGLATDDISNLGSYGEGPGDGGDDDDGGDGAVLSCTSDVTAIHAIQGDGLVSALVGQSVDVQGVVTSNQEAGLRGFYLQTPDAAVDGDVQTSEGIFVYTGNAPRGVVQGNLVRVRATVAEFNGLTELANVLDVATCEENVALPQATTLALPWTSLADAEAYEGMLVEFEQNLTVNEVYQLGRYGEVLLGSERHFIGTQVASPGSAALAASASPSIMVWRLNPRSIPMQLKNAMSKPG